MNNSTEENRHPFTRTMRPSSKIRIFPGILASGFSAAVGQIILLRELMVLFFGIELCLGAVLAAWLVWSALGCRIFVRISVKDSLGGHALVKLLTLTAMILPLALLLIRGAGLFWGIVPGEIPPLSKLLQICLVCTFPFSFLSGALFGQYWALMQKITPIPLAVYVGEALGAAVGGAVFYLFIAVHCSALAILLTVSLTLLMAAAWLHGTFRKTNGRWKTTLVITTCFVILFFGMIFEKKLDFASRQIHWGPGLQIAVDTPYQNLAVIHKNRQYSFFSNGLWLYSSPDSRSLEYAVHPALLQHPGPVSVLLLGGGSAGLPEEILKHPSIRHIDVVGLDSKLADLSRNHPPRTRPLSDAEDKIQWHYRDAAEFLRAPGIQYDVVLMNVGDPINAQMNRFYTDTMFSAVQERLAPKGIFSFGMSGDENMLGEVQVQFLGTIYRTLGQIFSSVFVLPGDPVQFFAADDEELIATDPKLMLERLERRGLHLSHVRRDTLQNAFNAFRVDYLSSVLEETPLNRINKNFKPLCYVYALQLWTAQWHSQLGKAMASLFLISPKTIWFCLSLACILVIGVYLTGKIRAVTAVYLSVASVGMFTMVTQMVLLIVFQIMAGALFLHLAFIVALFMTGLAGGAGWLALKQKFGHRKFHAGTILVWTQLLTCLFPLLLAGLFLLVDGPLQSFWGFGEKVILFSTISLISGSLGGVHFAAATTAMSKSGLAASNIGGRLYALDLVGAAGGLFLATFFLIPLLGPLHTLPLLSIVTGTSLIVLRGRVFSR